MDNKFPIMISQNYPSCRFKLQCGHNQKNTDTEEKKGNTENTES